MSPEQALAAVQDAVALVLELPAASVAADQRFAEDLSADSLAMVEILDQLEERLGVTIPDQDVDAFCTVGDAVSYLSGR